MKVIGLLGGPSWPSTFSFYDRLNRAAQKSLGGFHSARIMLYSIDYHPIKSLYNHGWDKIPSLLAQEIRYFLEKKPDCMILCNNTLHRAFDLIQNDLDISIPVFHAGHLAAEKAQRMGYKTVLLLATAFTMEDGFFAEYFQEKGIEVVVPSTSDRQTIQEMQSELAKGNIDPSYEAKFVSILNRYPNVDAIALACTELPLIINKSNSPKPLINTVHCQCDAAAQFAYNSGA